MGAMPSLQDVLVLAATLLCGGVAGTRLVDMERNGACLIRQLGLEPVQL